MADETAAQPEQQPCALTTIERCRRDLEAKRACAEIYAMEFADAGAMLINAAARRREMQQQRQQANVSDARERARKSLDLRLSPRCSPGMFPEASPAVARHAASWRVGWPKYEPFGPARQVPPLPPRDVANLPVWTPRRRGRKLPPPQQQLQSAVAAAKDALRAELASRLDEVEALLRKWAVDVENSIGFDDLSLAMGALQFKSASPRALKDLFIELDVDGDGTLDGAELRRVLGVKPSAWTKHGGGDSPHHLSLPTRRGHRMLPDESGAEKRAVAALKKVLHLHLDRVQDLFLQWDTKCVGASPTRAYTVPGAISNGSRACV